MTDPDPALTPHLPPHPTGELPMYAVPADPSAPPSCCLQAVAHGRREFLTTTTCPVHGERHVGHCR
jgi:hypothetical protein